jgi:hypothetical protein
MWNVEGGRSLYNSPNVFVAIGTRLSEVYRLRYRRYVVDQGMEYPSIGAAGELEDPIDRTSLNLAYSATDGPVINAVRLTWLETIPQDDYYARLMDGVPSAEKFRTAVSSRAVAHVQSDIRSTVTLWRCAYAISLASGCEKLIMSTKSEHLPLFFKFGWLRTGGLWESPISGIQMEMVLHLLDLPHLRAISSPFGLILDAYLSAARREAPQP